MNEDWVAYRTRHEVVAKNMLAEAVNALHLHGENLSIAWDCDGSEAKTGECLGYVDCGLDPRTVHLNRWANDDRRTLARTIAHEVYHCWRKIRRLPPIAPHHEEGLADAFADRFVFLRSFT